MCPQTRRFLAGAATLLALAATGPAHAAEPSPGEVAHAAAAKKKKGPTRGEKAVAKALRNAARRKQISRRNYKRYRKLYSRARKTRKRLRRARGRELGAVIRALDRIALRRSLTASRMPALFLILQRNTQFWPRKPFPRNHDRVIFRGSELVFEYYSGKGLQLQPLVNFKKANLMHGACVKPGGEPCNRAGLAKLLRAMVKTSSRRGSFLTWEYYFAFGGGAPPWMSGMAQATGIQAFARASQLLADPRLLNYARDSFGAFQTPPPTGVATTGPFTGTHYLQYSFAPRLFIFNAFLQSVIGLYDYAAITGNGAAQQLYARAEPEARLEVPASDTGDWSLYSFRGRESTREYHELLREFMAGLCNRVKAPEYCAAAGRYRDYMTDPAALVLTGPSTAVKGEETLVTFNVSKLSAVEITITIEGRTSLNKVATFRRGNGSFAWKPGSAGTYEVRLAAKELRTGQGLRTRTNGEIESLP